MKMSRIESKIQVVWAEELRQATLKGKVEDMVCAVEHGAQIDTPYHGGWTLVHFAVRNRRINALEFLLQRGARVNAWKDDKSTALHVAASNGFFDVCLLLVKYGAQNLTNFEGNTPFHLAANHGHCDIVDYFLTRGLARCDEANSSGATALHLASSSGHDRIVELLIRISRRQGNNQRRGLKCPPSDILKLQHSHVRNFVNMQSVKGNTALHVAAHFGRDECVKHLISNGANAKIVNLNGQNPLHIATKRRRNTCIRIILGTQQSPGNHDKSYLTPIERAQKIVPQGQREEVPNKNFVKKAEQVPEVNPSTTLTEVTAEPEHNSCKHESNVVSEQEVATLKYLHFLTNILVLNGIQVPEKNVFAKMDSIAVKTATEMASAAKRKEIRSYRKNTWELGKTKMQQANQRVKGGSNWSKNYRMSKTSQANLENVRAVAPIVDPRVE